MSKFTTKYITIKFKRYGNILTVPFEYVGPIADVGK